MADGTHLRGPWSKPKGLISGQFRMRKRYVLYDGIVFEDGLEYQQRHPHEQGTGYGEWLSVRDKRDEPCGHVYEGSDPGTICDSCGRIHKAAEWLASTLDQTLPWSA